MNEIKEIFESLSNRIRSPYFGFFILYSIGLNWKSWLLLAFDEKSISDRITCFNDSTSFMSIVAFPLVLGFATALISPWLKLFFVWAAKTPVTKRNIVQANAESKILEEKEKLANARARLLGTEEESLIAKTERDMKVQSIKDKEARQKLEKEIEELRKNVGATVSGSGTVTKPEKEAHLNVKLKQMPNSKGHKFYISNSGSGIAYNVMFKLLIEDNKDSPLTSDVNEVFPVSELHPGDEVSVLAGISIGMGPKFEAELTWETSSGEKKSKRSSVTL